MDRFRGRPSAAGIPDFSFHGHPLARHTRNTVGMSFKNNQSSSQSKTTSANVSFHDGVSTAETGWRAHLSAVARGDESALATLYDATSSLVYSVALRILMNRSDAEEVTLDVYTQVWRQAAAFDPRRGNVGTWLVMLARSRAIDRARLRSNRSRREESGVETLRLASNQPTPEQAAADSQLTRQINRALAVLSPEQRQVIEMSYFFGLSHSEVAARLRQPIGTVKTRIRLGMMRLRAVFEVAVVESAVT